MFKATLVALIFSLFISAQTCFAHLSISVIPVDGSNSLRFDRVPVAGKENKVELRVRVNATNGDRYQVFQRVLEPIMNEKGESLNTQAIETQSLPSSNSYGTLYLQNSGHLSMGDQLLYASSQNGDGDSFTVGYVLNPALFNASGNFRGRLIFTVRGTGNDSNDQLTLDVLLTGTTALKASVKGSRNPNRIHVKNTDTSEQVADYINIAFTGNANQEIRIYQNVEALPQNETGQTLGPQFLQLDAQAQTEGLRVQGTNPLKMGKTLIYSSTKDEDNIQIYFLVNADAAKLQDAGTYQGKITYTVETLQGTQEFPMDVQSDVPPVFSMEITPPPGGVNFTHVLPNTPPQDKEVLVTVFSNLHKPYQVVQDLQSNMVNQQGKEYNGKYFMMQVQIPAGQKGQTNLVEFAPVALGEKTIYSSDGRGSGTTFEVVYRLQGYNQMNAGNFSAPLRFSLNQK